MGLLAARTPYVDGTPAKPSDANANESNVYTKLNGLLEFDNILAALINAAGGFVQLDASALVPLAQIPPTLTGKDADTVDGVDVPATIAEVLTDHDKAAHDALDIKAGSVDAEDVINVPAGDIEAEDVQAALDELDDEKLADVAESVDAVNLAAAAVETAKIKDAAVTEGKIASGAVTQVKIADDAVGRSQVKWASGSVSVSSGAAHRTLPGGGFACCPATKGSANYDAQLAKGSTIGTYATIIYISCPTGTGYAQVNYIQSSPPYEIEHFIYLLLEKGSIISGWEAPDPPWYGQEGGFLHPFLDVSEGQTVILVSPDSDLMSELNRLRKETGKGYLELIDKFSICSKLEKERGHLTEKIISSGVEFRKLIKKEE